MKLIRSKTFLAVICIILAAAVAFVLLPKFYESQSATVDVIRVSQDIPVGTVIEKSMISTAKVGAYGLSNKIVTNVDDVVGKVAAEPLYNGEMLWPDRIITKEDYQAMVEEGTKGLTSGQCLVTLEFPSESSGIAGVLRAGNIVDVYEFAEKEEEVDPETGETIAPETIEVSKALDSMYVYDVLNSNLESLDDLDAEKEAMLADESKDFDFNPVYVVFRCSEDQALTLIRLEKMEALHLTLKDTEE